MTQNNAVGSLSLWERAGVREYWRYADLNERNRIHNRHNLSGRRMTQNNAVGSLSLGRGLG